MTTQYTPGPWFVRQRKHVVEIDNGLESPDYRHITNALPWSDGGPIDKHGVSLQVLADARLIAAAPSLLKALKAIRPWLAAAVADDAFRHCALPLGGSKALRQAEIAVAEAEGELRK